MHVGVVFSVTRFQFEGVGGFWFRASNKRGETGAEDANALESRRVLRGRK